MQFTDNNDSWFIGDFEFCVLRTNHYKVYMEIFLMLHLKLLLEKNTFKSDIYSIGILMWEISSEQSPFINYEHDYYLAMDIVNGLRPKIVSEIPLEYKSLIEQCWNANSSKRPDINTLFYKIQKIKQSFYQNISSAESNKNKNIIIQSETNNNLEIYYTNTMSKQLYINTNTNNIRKYLFYL